MLRPQERPGEPVMTKDTHRLADRVRSAGGPVIEVVQATYHAWRAARTLRLGAGIAYYALFAVVPLLSIAAALVGFLVPAEDATTYLSNALQGIADVDVEVAAASIVDKVGRASTSLSVVGAIALLVSASVLFVALQDALNVIWEAPVRVGIGNTVRRRLLAFGVTLLAALFFISSFVIEAVLGLVQRWVPGDIAILATLRGAVATAGSWVIGVGTIALFFRVLPYAEVAWRKAFAGAAVTAALVTLGTSLIGDYVSRYATSSLSGAAGSVVALLVWVYYQAQIVLGGAVLTRVLQERGRTA